MVATDPCGAITYTYALDGEQLTLDMIDDQCDGGVDELIAQTVIFESSPFTLESPAESAAADVAPTPYVSTSFVVPFEVTPPEWAAPEPAAELPNFVTWEGSAVDRGIRFLVPVNVYLPGETSPTAPPDDYLAYLLSQAEHGATFEDVVETTVDGRPATVDDRDDTDSLDGSLGCQEEGMFAADCFGLQPDLILRIAVIDTDDRTTARLGTRHPRRRRQRARLRVVRRDAGKPPLPTRTPRRPPTRRPAPWRRRSTASGRRA